MRTNIVLSNVKMSLINVALHNMMMTGLPLPYEPLHKMNCRIENQLVKSFGEFKISHDDSAVITIAVRALWDNHKKSFLANNTRAGRIIRKNMQSVLDTFTGVYMDTDSNVKRGCDFRKQFNLGPLDMNC